MDTKIFDRVEKKYLITKDQRQTLLKQIRQYLREDHYFESEIFSIYFDNENFDLIIQSIDHPIFKGKLRARSYGGYDKVFLEIKTKIRGFAYRHDLLENDDSLKDNNVGYKRRVLITLQDYEKFVKSKATAEELAAQNIEHGTDLQIAREIDYMRKYFNLKPQILIYYNRESYIDGNGLRITFDTDLHYRTSSLKFSKNARDKVFFKTDKNIIMEIKANGVMPLWLVKALSAERIYPEQFSKISKIYERIITASKNRSQSKKSTKAANKTRKEQDV